MTSFTKIFHHAPYPSISPSNPVNSQAGRTVAITGSAMGIGYGIAKAFIEAEAAGVILLGRNSATLEKAAASLKDVAKSTEVTWRICDINDDDNIETFWHSLAVDKVTIDVLVLNAVNATLEPTTPLLPRLPTIREMFKANVNGNALMFAHHLEQESSTPKTLINISSAVVHSNPSPNSGVYSACKAAFANFLQHVTEEVEASKCQVISIHPGVIRTEGFLREAHPEFQKIAIFDQVELPAAYSVWASTPAASFLHGRFVWAHWDVDELIERKAEFEDPGLLKVGVQGMEHLDVRTIMDKIREKDAQANGKA